MGRSAFGGGNVTRTSVSYSPKTAARNSIESFGINSVQESAVKRAIGKATSSSNITLTKESTGSIIVEITRPGRDGYQVMEYVVKTDGSKSVIQKAFDSSGKQVHYHPKK